MLILHAQARPDESQDSGFRATRHVEFRAEDLPLRVLGQLLRF